MSFIFLSSRMSFEFRDTGGRASRLSSYSGEDQKSGVTLVHVHGTRDDLGLLELPALLRTFLFRHLEVSLALADVQALAVVARGFACALTLAGICPYAMALGGLCRGVSGEHG
ncbi:MAG TPA: hypothetical protein VLD66_03475, partial [Methyloceanibacter sp.]|nr:hypothetical protein [Methyloceanibacter sp.]